MCPLAGDFAPSSSGLSCACMVSRVSTLTFARYFISLPPLFSLPRSLLSSILLLYPLLIFVFNSCWTAGSCWPKTTADTRFEMMPRRKFAIVCFRLNDDNKKKLDTIQAEKNMYPQSPLSFFSSTLLPLLLFSYSPFLLFFFFFFFLSLHFYSFEIM